MNILISGSSGFVGKNLIKSLSKKGYSISRLIRNKKLLGKDDVFWDPLKMELDPAAIEGFDVVIHLAGENLASKLWTKNQKNKIVKSRVYSTQLLSQTLPDLKVPPGLFICASATGYYGHRGDEIMDEKCPPGDGFLAEVVLSWEKATESLKNTGIRVVNLRSGVILGKQGGLLARLLPLFKMGLGGRIGSGQQFMPWISIHDVLEIICFLIKNNQIQGAVNVVSPIPCCNAEFTKALAYHLSRPAVINVPAWLLQAVFGEMANELFLASTKVRPSVLMEYNYPFIHTTIDQTLNSILKKD